MTVAGRRATLRRIMPILRLQNEIQRYPWGSLDAIPRLLRLSNRSREPMAELWMGAHPKAPSRVEIDSGTHQALGEFIAQDPERVLGPEPARRFNGRLPFLFKILAVHTSLSIQAHPTREQAREGYEREERAGIPIDAFERNYRDKNSKPEMIVAMGEFWALRGFRPLQQIRELLSILGCPEILAGAFEALGRDDEADAYDALLQALLDLPAEQADTLLRTADQIAQVKRREPLWYWVHELSRSFPRDLGAIAPLYLNLIKLRPGEAMFLPAGELHAYLRGSAIEIQGSSDNVLRGGLTSKHIDRDELRRILRFESTEVQIIDPEVVDRTARVYRTPVEEFELWRHNTPSLPAPKHLGGEPGAVTLETGNTPEILLSLDGYSDLRFEDRVLRLEPGESAFVTADTERYSVSGSAVLYRARVGNPAGDA